MRRRGFLLGLALVLFVMQSACSRSDEAPDYSYRLTVEVETPEGLRRGSSVIQVRQRLGRSAVSPGNSSVSRRAYGEAVAVDLPGGRTLFALLRSEQEVDWAASVMQYAAPKFVGEDFEEQLDNMLLIKGEVTLPRYWPPFAGGLRMTGYPMLVTFGDIADPTSVTRVDPDDLAVTFGEGVSLRRITVEITDDPVTTGIEERLGWINEFRHKHFDGSSVVSDDLTADDLRAHLSSGSFSTEYAR